MMSGIESAVVAEVVATVVTNVAASLARRLAAAKKVPFSPEQVDEAIASASIAQTLDDDFDDDDLARLRPFVASAEFRNIARQVALIRATAGTSEDIQSVKREFLLLLGLYATVSSEDVPRRLFGVLLQAVDESLRQLSEAGIDFGEDVQQDAFANVVRSHLGAIARNVELIASQTTSTESVADFENLYRAQVENRHRLIMPPNFGGSKRVPIESLYVNPYLEDRVKPEESTTSRLGFSEFMGLIRRTVVLGDPGGGKSTMSQKICLDLSSNDLFTASDRQTPILVILRDYGAAKKRKNCSIRDFIAETINSTYQVPPPAGALDFLLLNGRATVIFDGLDELLDSSYRREVSGDVESFCNLYPSTAVLVTSRLVGYDEAPLDPTEFDVFKLAELDDDQVEEYARKWFGLDDRLSSEERDGLATAFLAESEVVADLRSNPLMLSLMCNIYKGENYIPTNRPDVYEKCALMLFERWDAGRNIKYGLPFESLLRPTMMHLAYEIYSKPSMQGGVSRSTLEKLAKGYLLDRRYDDEDEALDAARRFIEFCTGRAWVFTDVGTTAAGEPLFQFTHRTFLEYFTAGYLVRQNPTPDALFEVLAPHVVSAEWDVVAQLAIQMQNRNVESGGELLLTRLASLGDDDRSRLNALSFCARCLQFLVPSIRETKNVASAVTEATVDLIEQLRDQFLFGPSGRPVPDVDPPLGPLLQCADENYPAVQAAVTEAVERCLREGRKGAADIVWNLRVLFETGQSRLEREREPEWAQRMTDLRHQYSGVLKQLALSDPAQAVSGVRAGLISLDDAVGAHDFGVLLLTPWGCLANLWYFSLAEQIARDVAWPTSRAPDSDEVASVQLADEFAQMISPSAFPWFLDMRSRHVGLPHLFESSRHGAVRAPLGSGSRALEGAAVLFAVLVECVDQAGSKASLGTWSRTLGNLSMMLPVLDLRASRMKPSDRRLSRAGLPDAKASLSRAGFREPIIDLLLGWASGVLALVRDSSAQGRM